MKQHALYSVYMRPGRYAGTIDGLCTILDGMKALAIPVPIRLAAAVSSTLIGVSVASVGIASPQSNGAAQMLLFTPNQSRKLCTLTFNWSTKAVSDRVYYAATAF